MKILLLLFIGSILLCTNAFVNLEKSPPSFIIGERKAVWANFITASYSLKFNVLTQTYSAISIIEFEIKEKGHPIFDSVSVPTSISIDSEPFKSIEVTTPSNETKVRILNKSFAPGLYKMIINTPITKGVKFSNGKVSAEFFMNDMKDRYFLERYLPSILEYDQYKMTISITILGTTKLHILLTNGNFNLNSDNEFKVTYPEFYNSSALYFHLVPRNKFKIKTSKFNSIDGRTIPLIVYSHSKVLNSLVMSKVKRTMKELERDYGSWPHRQMILYSNGKIRGGMESGAAISGWFAIGHELQHSYFARAVLPVNGNAGWIDEGIASWRDYLHGSKKNLKFIFSGLAGNSSLIRTTSKSSYEKGRAFISHIN